MEIPSRVRHFRNNGVGIAFIERQPELIELLLNSGEAEITERSYSPDSYILSDDEEQPLDTQNGQMDDMPNEKNSFNAVATYCAKQLNPLLCWLSTTYAATGLAVLALVIATASLFSGNRDQDQQEDILGEAVKSITTMEETLAEHEQRLKAITEALDRENSRQSLGEMRTKLEEIQTRLGGLAQAISPDVASKPAAADSPDTTVTSSAGDPEPVKASPAEINKDAAPPPKSPVSSKPRAPSGSAQAESWSINLIALRNLSNAKRLVEQGAAKGITITSREVTDNKGLYVRLSVDGYTDKESAREAAPGIASLLGLSETWVTQN